MSTIRAQAIELYCRVAVATDGAGETPLGSNAGPYVERVQKAGGLKKGDPWCLAAVMDWGQQALPENPHLELLIEGLRWALPKVGGCQYFYEWAEKKGIISATPERGDIGLIWHPELKPTPRFAHALLVLDPSTSLTISGNTTSPKDANVNDPKASREGWCVARKPWKFKPADRYARWANLIPAQ